MGKSENKKIKYITKKNIFPVIVDKINKKITNRITEKMLVNDILDYLTIKGCVVWRNNTGAVKASYTDRYGCMRSRFIRYAQKGSPDIIGFDKQGRFIAIEVKLPGNKPSPDQTEWMKKAIDNNCRALIAYSIDDVMSTFR